MVHKYALNSGLFSEKRMVCRVPFIFKREKVEIFIKNQIELKKKEKLFRKKNESS